MLACSKTNISEPVIHALQFFPWPFHPPPPEKNVAFLESSLYYYNLLVDENKTESKKFSFVYGLFTLDC